METDLHTVAVIAALAAVTLLARSFFLISQRPRSLPRWAERGLQYAPVAALAAVVVPEVLMTQGQLVQTLADARIYAALAGAAVYFWRRSVLWTILVGMAVYLPLHLMRGW